MPVLAIKKETFYNIYIFLWYIIVLRMNKLERWMVIKWSFYFIDAHLMRENHNYVFFCSATDIWWLTWSSQRDLRRLECFYLIHATGHWCFYQSSSRGWGIYSRFYVNLAAFFQALGQSLLSWKSRDLIKADMILILSGRTVSAHQSPIYTPEAECTAAGCKKWFELLHLTTKSWLKTTRTARTDEGLK